MIARQAQIRNVQKFETYPKLRISFEKEFEAKFFEHNEVCVLFPYHINNYVIWKRR